jgi:surface antigen Omp85-like protein
MRRALWSFTILGMMAGGVPAARGQDPPRRRVVAGEKYQAGGLHRALFGADYRDLWAMPVEVPVLDLQRYAGGLRPVRRVGGQETKGLALKGADGRDYTFRGVDKDPTEILPPELRESVAGSIVRDQIASSHPAGSVIVPPLLEAAGILHATPELVVMPDDPALGEFRPVFANLVGTIEVYPRPVGGGNPGFEGATDIINGEEMWKRLQASPADRIDTRAFLKARLFDVFIGDWDRHRSQWRWAKLPSSPLWQPIPEDRDQAFVRFEGFFLSLFRKGQPRLVVFGPKYSRIEGVTFNGWEVDRKLLSELDQAAWTEVARDLQGRLTDSVLQAAVARMPAEYRARDGARLLAALKARRDAMTSEAGVYYRHLADKVDVFATDRADRVELTGLAGGGLEVTLADDAAASAPYFHRTLLPADTDEVRIHLGAGNDRVVARGVSTPITARVIGDAGCESVEAAGGPDVRVSDTESCTTVKGRASLDHREYVPPPANPRAPWIPPRDWGSLTTSLPWLGYGPDLGAFLGASVTRVAYGFRKDSYASRQRFRAGYATAARAARVDYQGDFHRENSPTRIQIAARASGIEILRFYGLGNETLRLPSDDLHKVKQQQYLFAPSLVFELGRNADFSIGPEVQYSTTSFPAGRLISAVRPYGSEDFGQVGGRASVLVDRRNRGGYATSGGLFRLEGRAFPGVWGVRSTYGEVHGDASTYLTPGGSVQPTLALRVGGKRVWGDYPFQEAAYIGGHTTVRGLRAERFGGDGSLYGNAELRLPLGRVSGLLPGEFGIFGLGDVGRVFLQGESSRKWHTAAGGGVWFSFFSRANTLSVAIAKSEERTGLYVDAGFMF